ncbi:MAG: mreD [Gammaproteobacteria bacterium]|jgi:rod shape-determining protein MreD|nr:mreD [Gammaproteobacteria bacterium]
MIEVHRKGFIILISFLIAFILTLLPLPSWAVWLSPAWVLMILVYWVIAAPERINIGCACIAGIFLDVLQGTLLGEHALALILVIYLVTRVHSRLRMFALLQQSMIIFLFVLLYQGILFCIQGFLGILPSSWLYWSCSLTSMLLWPWVCSILRGWTYA